MIQRIVMMTFDQARVDEFLVIFDNSSSKIRDFPGCLGLKLWQNTSKPNQISTFSIWESEYALENYRHSELFSETWSKTKILFCEKPIAISNQIIRELND